MAKKSEPPAAAPEAKPAKVEVEPASGKPLPALPVNPPPASPRPAAGLPAEVADALNNLQTRVGGIEDALKVFRDQAVEAPHRVITFLKGIHLPGWDD